MSDEYEAGAPLDAASVAALEKFGGDDVLSDAIPAPVTGKADPQQAVSDARDEPDYEAVATMIGWSPKDQWRGDDDKWIDARAFVDKANQNPQIYVERIKTLDRRRKDDVARIERVSTLAVERAREEARQREADLKQERDALIREARSRGDVDAALNVEARYNQEIANQLPPETVAARDNWIAQHPDYLQDPAFRSDAYSLMASIQAQYPKDQPEKWFSELDRRMSRLYPDKYPDDVVEDYRKGAPSVPRQPDGVKLATRKAARASDRLPADAKRLGEQYVKDGLFPSIDEYAKEYFND